MGFLRRSLPLTAALLCLALPAALAAQATSTEAKTSLIMPPPPLLPTTPQLAAPDTSAPPIPDKPETPALLKEDGLETTATRTILASASKPTGWVRAYQFVDATGAFAAYTFFRDGARNAPAPRVNATESLAPTGEVVFLSGVSVVRAHLGLPPDAAAALLKKIEIGLPKIGGRKGLAPLLPTYLPGQALDPASVRYALGPVGYQSMGGILQPDLLGWDKSAEAITGTYAAGPHAGHGTLTLLLYPTPQIAGDRGRAVEKSLNDSGGSARFGTVKMRRLGPLVGITSGGFTPHQAQELVASLHLSQDLSFDKPMPLEFHAEVRKTATLLQSIAIFCGLGVLAAIILGVFLGGARAGIRVLQGKPAWSEPEFLTINLHDKPKALFAPRLNDTEKS